MNKYYIFVNNVVSGPFSIEQIRSMYNSGQINGMTQISAGRGTPWLMLSQRPEIMTTIQTMPGAQQVLRVHPIQPQTLKVQPITAKPQVQVQPAVQVQLTVQAPPTVQV